MVRFSLPYACRQSGARRLIDRGPGRYDLTMVIFETPSKQDNGGPRIAVFGSCRLRHPVSRLHDDGDIRICNWGLKEVHSILEVKQSLDFVRGARTIDDRLSDYVFETPYVPDVSALASSLRDGVDVFLIEVSDSKQFCFDDVIFQQNFFARQFVRRHGELMLPWFRSMTRGQAPDEAVVAEILSRLPAEVDERDALAGDILRRMRLTRSGEEEVLDTLKAMIASVGGRWIVFGAVTMENAPQAMMRDRRTLNENLKSACEQTGALFYDPAELIAEHGKETVMDAGGANLYEWSPAFYPTVGRKLLELIGKAVRDDDRPEPGGARTEHDGAGAPAGRSPAVAQRIRGSRAERINAELVAAHRPRLARLGETDSGLYSHYARLLEQNALVGPRDRTALALIEDHLPDYDAYAVIRAGLGELAFLIAAGGRRVIACEPSARRRGAIEDGLEELQARGLIEPGRVTIVDTLMPAEPLSGRVLGVAVDASEVRDDAAAAPHIARATAFDGLLIDPRLFIRQRDDPADQAALIERLGGLGFTHRRDYFADRMTWLGRGSGGAGFTNTA